MPVAKRPAMAGKREPTKSGRPAATAKVFKRPAAVGASFKKPSASGAACKRPAAASTVGNPPPARGAGSVLRRLPVFEETAVPKYLEMFAVLVRANVDVGYYSFMDTQDGGEVTLHDPHDRMIGLIWGQAPTIGALPVLKVTFLGRGLGQHRCEP